MSISIYTDRSSSLDTGRNLKSSMYLSTGLRQRGVLWNSARGLPIHHPSPADINLIQWRLGVIQVKNRKQPIGLVPQTVIFPYSGNCGRGLGRLRLAPARNLDGQRAEGRGYAKQKLILYASRASMPYHRWPVPLSCKYHCTTFGGKMQ